MIQFINMQILFRLILGNISRNWKPVRNPKSKYYITQEQYDKENYPDFATGPSYLISGNIIRYRIINKKISF